jgi:hypothetical protein
MVELDDVRVEVLFLARTRGGTYHRETPASPEKLASPELIASPVIGEDYTSGVKD